MEILKRVRNDFCSGFGVTIIPERCDIRNRLNAYFAREVDTYFAGEVYTLDGFIFSLRPVSGRRFDTLILRIGRASS